MEIQDIENLIRNGLAGAEVVVDGEGCNFSVIVISEHFQDCSLLEKQKMVLKTVDAPISTGDLHAITIKAFTPDEWQARNSACPGS